jgi:hypothetical protein
LRFLVQADDADIPDEHELINMVSEWWLASEPTERSLFSGNFNWGAGDFVFVFGLQGSTSLRMEGTGVSDEQVSGTFRDRDGFVFPLGCSASATATHITGSVN